MLYRKPCYLECQGHDQGGGRAWVVDSPCRLDDPRDQGGGRAWLVASPCRLDDPRDQGRGKPSPYPIRLGITLRIGYGLGLPLPWASYSCRYDRVLSCVIKVFGINLCGGMCSFPIDGALNSFIDVYALFIPQFLTDARGVDDDVLFCVDVPS